MRLAVAYVRVSTERQGRSGLGIQGQTAQVRVLAEGWGLTIQHTYQDIQTGKGADGLAKRPGLRAAVIAAKRMGCPIIVSDLSRLARNTAVIQQIVAELGDGKIISVEDYPDTDALELQARAARAEITGEEISRRTRKALKRLKREGKKLGNRTNLREAQALGVKARQQKAAEFAADIYPTIFRLQNEGFASKLAVANELNRRQISASRGGRWTHDAVARVLAQIEKLSPAACRKLLKTEVKEPFKAAAFDPLYGSW